MGAGNVVESVDSLTAAVEERANVIGQPERTEDVEKRFFRINPGKIGLGNEERNVCGYAVFVPDVQDVRDECWFVVEITPLNFAGIERIVFEGKEGEISEALWDFR